MNPLWRPGHTMKEVSDEIFNGILPQRKAFIDLLNDVFYKEQNLYQFAMQHAC